MLAKSQAIPLSVNLHLLKSMINQTCSTKAVVENFPSYADQIRYVSKELNIDRVFQIAPSQQALTKIKQTYIERQVKKGMDEFSAEDSFDHLASRIEPIANHFASQGKLEKLEVNQAANFKDIRTFVDKAMQPQFAVIAGLPHSGSVTYAEAVAQQYGVAPAVTVQLLEEWAQNKANMEEPVTRADGDKFLKVLHKYATRRGSALLVLADYPGTAEESTAFMTRFGEPKVFADLDVAEQTLKDNAMANLSEEDEFNEDAYNEEMEAAGPVREALQTYWADFECYSKVNGDAPRTKDDVVKDVCAGLLPRAYVVVCPSGRAGLSNKVAGGLACSGKDGKDKRPIKFTVLDTNVLCEKGEHSADIEERLAMESFTSTSADALPVSLWTDLFKEAFAKSPNPLGNFVIVNMPTTSTGVSGVPSIRDQFNMLEGICTLVGIIVVECTEDGYLKWCFDTSEEANAYSDQLAKIEEYVEKYYVDDRTDERVMLFKTKVDAEENPAEEGPGEDEVTFGSAFHEAARKVGFRIAAEFFRHRELKMHGVSIPTKESN